MKYELTYRCKACEMDSKEIWNDLPSDIKNKTAKFRICNCEIFEDEKGFGPHQGVMELISYRTVEVWKAGKK